MRWVEEGRERADVCLEDTLDEELSVQNAREKYLSLHSTKASCKDLSNAWTFCALTSHRETHSLI